MATQLTKSKENIKVIKQIGQALIYLNYHRKYSVGDSDIEFTRKVNQYNKSIDLGLIETAGLLHIW